MLREGSDVSLWAIGTMVESAMKLAEKLAEQGINAGVVNMRLLNPLIKNYFWLTLKNIKISLPWKKVAYVAVW